MVRLSVLRDISTSWIPAPTMGQRATRCPVVWIRSMGNSMSSSDVGEKSSDSRSGVVESSGFINIVFLSMVLINYRVTGYRIK